MQDRLRYPAKMDASRPLGRPVVQAISLSLEGIRLAPGSAAPTRRRTRQIFESYWSGLTRVAEADPSLNRRDLLGLDLIGRYLRFWLNLAGFRCSSRLPTV